MLIVDNKRFLIICEGKLIDELTAGTSFVAEAEQSLALDVTEYSTVYRYEPKCLRITLYTKWYRSNSLQERWIEIVNEGNQTVRIERLDSFQLELPVDAYELMHYTSCWGGEFEPIREVLAESFILEGRTGRSSGEKHPWFTLFSQAGAVIMVSPIWSGNWAFGFNKQASGKYMVNGGLHDWEFHKDLLPDAAFTGIHIALAYGQSLNETSIAYARVGREHWYLQTEQPHQLPVGWNHWWSYEDTLINETVFKRNAEQAAKLGLEICILDAGWYGSSDPEIRWTDRRGDWDQVNTERFPSGIRALADYTHELGLKFGLWCEIEALNTGALVNIANPQFAAWHDDEHLQYACFGNPEVRSWAFALLDRLITEYQCDWIKLDFNNDPRAGCNRVDHGHGSGVGLYEHYQGYYQVIQQIHQKHPTVILENCSSGGLRVDLGIMRYTHATFLSDQDYPEHSLQLFWGATTMLAPERLLRWSFSETFSVDPPMNYHPRLPDLKRHQFDYYTRVAMMAGMGFSQKLPELPDWVSERMTHHVAIYKQHIRGFIANKDLYRLTDQPRRGGLGDRWAAFQFASYDGSEHLLFVFRLIGAEKTRKLTLKGLQSERVYQLSWLSEEKRGAAFTGAELMAQGLLFDSLLEEDSVIIRISG